MTRRIPAHPIGLYLVLVGAACGLGMVVAHAAHATWVLVSELWEVVR